MGPAVEVVAWEDAEALGAIERALHGKLRAHRLSESFIERHGEDAVQQGIAEYERALAQGGEIENPGGWIVATAYRRAIDELRRELREIDEADLTNRAGVVKGGELFSPTEEEALDNVSAEQLRETIAKLTAEQRQALGLYFFEERTTREAAAVLGCGETTVRRHLRSAMRVLRERFGVVPEPGSGLAIEVGFAAWTSLAGARVVPSRGALDQLIAVADAAREAAAGTIERGRDLAARLLASGGGETIGAAASSPLGKAAGLCAGAFAACALTGVLGPGVGGVDLVGGGGRPPAQRHVTRPRRPPPLKVAAPVPAPPPAPRSSVKGIAASPGPSRHRASGSSAEERTRQATEAASSQFGVESAAPEAGYSPPPEPTESSSSTSTASSSSPTQIANEQFGP